MSSNWSRDTRRIVFKSWQRRFILRRDKNICYVCGGFGDQTDHVVPIAEGGANHTDNGACICEACHEIKSRQESERGYARKRAVLKLPTDPHPFFDQES